MRLARFLLALLPTLALLWLLKTPLSIGEKTLPPLGAFINPFSGFWQNAEPARPFTGQDLSQVLPGLKGPVEVVWDDALVPHIFAQNIADAVMVQGYVTAQHRLFQMDLGSRQTAGRLSEIFGPRTLDLDRLTRRRGLPFAAENDWAAWQQSPRTAEMLEAYAAGVNAWIGQLEPADYPVEYKLLNFEPELWSPLKTCLLVESMIDALNGRDSDLAATNSLAVFGRDTFDYLYPRWNPKQTPIVPDTGQWAGIRPPVFSVDTSRSIRQGAGAATPQRALPPSDGDLNGSNNWAVAGSRTKSGHPILCNDMHLPLRLPHTWYQQQIQTPEANCYGVVVPGVPGIAVGFNDDIAWGFTNVSQEVADWYRIRWADAGRTTYLLDGQPQKAEFRIEKINIKGRPALIDTVRYTVWGPVVYDDPREPLHDCAYRYTTHDAPAVESLFDFLNIGAAKNYEDYRRAIPGVDALSQNIAFASRNGAIALTVQGKFPIRAFEQGRFVQDGSARANAWHGFIPQEHLPALRNPSSGFVFSANQNSTPPSYPYYFLGNFDQSRGRRIYERLSTMRNITVDSMKNIQLDNFSRRAADGLAALLSRVDRARLNDTEKTYLAKLEKWDARYEPDSIAPALYEMWFDSTYDRTWDEMDAWNLKKTTLLYPEIWRFIEILQTDSASIFFDHLATPRREEAGDIVTEGFQRMAARAARLPADSLVWHTFKGFKLKHLTQLDAFSRLDVRVGGSRNSPNAISATHGPSWRMIVEMSTPVRALGVYPGGQSGNPGSRFYDYFVDAWARGEYYELLLLPHAADPNPRVLARQTFTPGS